MVQAKSLEDLMRIRAHNRELLDNFNGTLGTALGLKKNTNERISSVPAVIVFVPHKIHPKWLPGEQTLPTQLAGPDGLTCPVDVVEGGAAEEEDAVPRDVSKVGEALRGWSDKLWAGSQLAHWIDHSKGTYSMGTLGAYARHKNGKMGFLTNKHVGIQPGQKLFHPVPWGTHVGTTKDTLEYVHDQDWYSAQVDEPNTYVRVDCAFVELEQSIKPTDMNPELLGIGSMGESLRISLKNMDIIGQKVIRVGRTTGVRRGTVAAFGYEFRDESDVTVYTDLLIVGESGKPFSTHGDSGSLIVTDDEHHRPLGLLWGGWQKRLRKGHAQENWTYGVALTRVLDALDIELVRELT